MIALTLLPTEPLSGPFPTRAEACPACVVDRALPAPDGATTAELWADASYHPVGPEGSLLVYRLAVRTGAGWFVTTLGQDGTQCGGDAPFRVGWRLLGVETWSTPSGARMVVRAEAGGEARQTEVTVCGVGEMPSCTKLVPRGEARAGFAAWDVPLALNADGTITVGELVYTPTGW